MNLRDVTYLDIETVGEGYDGKLVAVGFAERNERVSVHMGDDVAWIRNALEDSERLVVTHSKYDLRWLRLAGWDVKATLLDTMVMAYVLNENQLLDLDSLNLRYLGRKLDKRIRRVAGVPLFRLDDERMVPVDEVPWDQMVRYNTSDVEGLRDLYLRLLELMDEKCWDEYWLQEEVPFTQVLLDMEVAGIPVNLEDVEPLAQELETEAAELERNLRERAGLPEHFNIGSNDQLAAYLYSFRFELTDALEMDPDAILCLKSCLDGEHEDCDPGPACDYPTPAMQHVADLLPAGFTITSVGRTKVHGSWSLAGRNFTCPSYTDSGKQQVSSPALRSDLSIAADEWVRDLLRWRKVTKALTTYLRVFPKVAHEGRIYGRFNQTGTKTGRLSSSGPNLQNIPAHGDLGPRIRKLFQGNLIVGDYSQLEPRLLAHFTQDPVLLDVYRTGKDIYNVTGSAIFGREVNKGDVERDVSKVVFLGDQYGMGPTKLAVTLLINGHAEVDGRRVTPNLAKGLQDEMHRLYRVAEQWKAEVKRYVHAKGYVRTIGGRHRRLRAAFKDRRNFKAVGYGERQAVNAVIQGSAGDIVRRVMVAYHRSPLQPRIPMLFQVHDELGFEYTAAPWHFCGRRVEGGYCPRDCAPREGRISWEQVNYDLELIRRLGETAHGFELSVPLVFEPHFGTDWFSAKEGEDTIALPDDDDDEEVDDD